MRRVLFFTVLLALSFSACKKLVENTARNYIIDVMVDGEWYIDSLRKDQIDATTHFAGYTFKFEENGTLIAKNGTNVVSGTWEGDIGDYSITATFPPEQHPVVFLNGKWVVKDSTETSVLAEMQTPTGRMVLRLRKKQ